jgi:hypothetical protein
VAPPKKRNRHATNPETNAHQWPVGDRSRKADERKEKKRTKESGDHTIMMLLLLFNHTDQNARK